MKVRKRPSSFFEYQLRDHVLLVPAGQNSINLSETAPRLQRIFPDQETWAWILTIEEWVEIQAGILHFLLNPRFLLQALMEFWIEHGATPL